MKTIGKLGLACGLVMVLCGVAQANVVTLTGVDGFGASSFNTAGLWDDGMAPSAGNDYFVPDLTRMRTPADGGSYTFAGDSLTINNVTAYGDGFMFKGTGSAGTITVDNLIMDGGLISHANGVGDIFNLDGALTVASGGARLYSKQGPINILADIGGSGQIDIPASDAVGCELTFLSSANTFTGNIVNQGRFTLADGANLNFVIGASGVNNSFSDPGLQQHAIFLGDFVLDLTAAGTTLGDSWQIIGTYGATYYDGNFKLVGFTNAGDNNTWFKQIDASSFYVFEQSTGTLTVAETPEPATLMLVAFGGLTLLRRRA